MKRVKIERVFILSSYRMGDCGMEHAIDGDPAKDPSLAGIDEALEIMIENLRGLPTGTRIRVTMEDVEEDVG